MADFEPIKPPYRLSREIVKQISAMVLDGELKPGTQLLPDRELAKRFNVSRPTLREALYVLEASGVVEARLGGGTYVAQRPGFLSSLVLEQLIGSDRDFPLEMMEVRCEFEVRNAKLAAKNATEVEVEELAKLMRQMEEDVSAGASAIEPDIDFHLTVAAAAHNRVRLFITASVFLKHFEILQESRRRITQRSAEGFLRQHRNIYLAIQMRDSEKAGNAMLEHLEAAYAIHAALVANAK